MSTYQAVTKVPVGDQESMSPAQEDAPAVMNEISTPLNFSELTPRQFGISVESFIPSSSDCKGKKPDLLLTSRTVYDPHAIQSHVVSYYHRRNESFSRMSFSLFFFFYPWQHVMSET